MALIYKPMILWDNVAERIGLTVDVTGATGYGVDKVTDNKHWTYYAPSEGGTVTFTMTGDTYVDTVMIQARKAQEDSDVTITYNGSESWDYVEGLQTFNIYKLETPVYVESVEIKITQPPNAYLYITHIWIGLSQRINNPTYEFDHDMMNIDAVRDKANTVYILNNVIGQKRLLQANFNNVATEMDDFLDYSYRYGKPFIFAWRPDDYVYDGGLYHFVETNRNNPYVKANRRNVSIQAETPWISTSRTLAETPLKIMYRTLVVIFTIDTFDYAVPTSYFVDGFDDVGTSWLADAFASVPTSDLIDEFDSIVDE